jgi:hypothetical protein
LFVCLFSVGDGAVRLFDIRSNRLAMLLNVPQYGDFGPSKVRHSKNTQQSSDIGTADPYISEALPSLSILNRMPASVLGLQSPSYDIRGVTALSYGSLDADVPLLRLLLWGGGANGDASVRPNVPNWKAFSSGSEFTVGGVIACGCVDGTVSIIDPRAGAPLHVWNANAFKNTLGMCFFFF